MINLKELKVGSIIYTQKDETSSASGAISLPELVDIGLNRKDAANKAQPMPLTSKWLEDFGFEKEERKDNDGDTFIVYSKDGIDIYDHTEYGNGFDYATYIKWDGQFKGGFNIPFVHRMQQFYFGLTGRELLTKEQEAQVSDTTEVK